MATRGVRYQLGDLNSQRLMGLGRRRGRAHRHHHFAGSGQFDERDSRQDGEYEERGHSPCEYVRTLPRDRQGMGRGGQSPHSSGLQRLQ